MRPFLNRHSLLSFVCSLTLATSCATPEHPVGQSGPGGAPAPSGPAFPQVPNPKSAGPQDTTKLRSPLEDAVTKTILGHIKAIEVAYALGRCEEVAVHAQGLQGNLTEALALSAPLSLFVALSDCADRRASHPSSSLSETTRSLEYLEQALQNLSPTWDRARLLKRKAERLEAIGRFDAAQKARLQLAAVLKDQWKEKLSNDVELVKLDPDTRGLSPLERDKVNEILALYLREDRLFETLRLIDAAASGGAETKPALSATLRKIRDQVLLRIEELFANDLAPLVSSLQSGQKQLSESMAQSLKQKYPTLTYQRRIDATFNALESPDLNGQTMPLPTGAGGSLALPDTSDLSPEQRLKQATEALDAGRPDHAVALLRAIPEQNRSAAASRLLSEAENVHIRNLRLRVTDLFKHAESKAAASDKIPDYEQALELLYFILREYPKNPVKRQIEKNIRSIETTLRQLKGPQR